MKVRIQADGGSRGNPGPAGYGSVVFDAATGAVLAERKESLGSATNNVAEYRGLIAGLEAAIEVGAIDVAVQMDSKLVVEQLSGRWQVKHPDMVPLARRALELARSFDSITYQWIPREKNKHADRLANEAMDAAAGKPVRPSVVVEPTVKTEPAAPLLRWVRTAGETPTRLVLVRHGSTEHSLARRYSGRNDLELDDAGRAQAEAAAQLVRRYSPTAIISSPVRRARRTADTVASVLGLPVSEDEGFAEADFGAWEGLAADEVQERWPAELSATQLSLDAAPPGGESFAAVARRVRRARDRVIAAHPGQTVVVVTHVTPIKSLVRSALDAPPSALFSMQLDTGSVTALEYYEDGAGVLRLFNETPPR